MQKTLCKKRFQNFFSSFFFTFFLDSLMKLFEGGILDKITSDEYEKMFQQMTAMQVNDVNVNKNIERDDEGEKEIDDNRISSNELQQQESSDGNANSKVKKESNEKELTALSLQMLQGAFYLLILGYLLAFLVFILEIGCHRMSESFTQKCRMKFFSLNRRLHQLRMRINHFRFSM